MFQIPWLLTFGNIFQGHLHCLKIQIFWFSIFLYILKVTSRTWQFKIISMSPQSPSFQNILNIFKNICQGHLHCLMFQTLWLLIFRRNQIHLNCLNILFSVFFFKIFSKVTSIACCSKYFDSWFLEEKNYLNFQNIFKVTSIAWCSKCTRGLALICTAPTLRTVQEYKYLVKVQEYKCKWPCKRGYTKT